MHSALPTRSNPYNFTPHAVNIFKPDGQTLVTYMSLGALRLQQQPQTVLYHCGTESGPAVVTAPVYTGLAEPLPPEFIRRRSDPDCAIIVSTIVAEWLARTPVSQHLFQGTVLTPDSSPEGTVRDDKGQIIGTRRLVQYVAARTVPPTYV